MEIELEALDKALKAFCKRLIKNGTFDDKKIVFRADDPDWDWISFTVNVSLHESRKSALIRAEWNPRTQRLCNWEGFYSDEPWTKFNVL